MASARATATSAWAPIVDVEDAELLPGLGSVTAEVTLAVLVDEPAEPGARVPVIVTTAD